MAQVKRVNINVGIDQINQILEQDGCVVLENILPASTRDGLKKEIDSLLENVPNCRGDFYGYVTKRMSGLIEKSKFSREIAVHPDVLQVMDHFLLPNCSQYQLNLTQVIQIGSGEPQQLIHTDDLMFRYSHAGSEAMINCMWAVDDFTEKNGATILVPGSHKWEKDRVPEASEITQGVMPAGSVLIYFGSLLHAGGANSSGAPRTGLTMSYNLGWLRQAENQYLATSRETASTLPKQLQKLIGYFVHEPNLGCVEGQDPIFMLENQMDTSDLVFSEYIPKEFHPALKEYRESQLKIA